MNKKAISRVSTLAILMMLVVITMLSRQFAAQLAPTGQWDNWNSSNQGILIDSMQSGWSAAYQNNIAALNNTNYVEGSGSIELSILPNSNNNFAGAITKSVNINLDNASNFYFWFYIQNASSLMGEGSYGVTLFLSNDANYNNYFQCGIISGGIQNGWNPIVIARSACQAVGSPSWTNNITSMEFRVALNNSATYTNNIITNFDNLRYNYGGGVFNKAQVILTFDGSWNSTLYNATPILQQNHQTGVAFIVTNQINQGADGGCGTGKCISSTEITELYSDGWDISSHTVDHANLAPNTTANIAYQLAKSFSTLQALGVDSTARFFAYPNGAYNNQVINEIKLQNNYTIARALGYGITQPNLFADSPYNLSYRVQSVTLTPSITPTTIENYINQVEAEKGLLVLTFHVIQPNACKSIAGYSTLGQCLNNSVEYSSTNFTVVSNYLASQQLQGKLQVTNFSAYSAAIGDQIPTSTTTIPTNSQTAVTLSPISNTIQAGQSNTITAIIAANSTLLDFPPDTYLWYWKTPTSSSYVRISGATSNTYTFAANVLTRPGVYDFNVIVTDGVSQFVTASSPSAITVLATGTSTTTIPATTTTTTIPASQTINVTLSPISNTILVGQSNTITAIITSENLFGFPPYQYQWYWKVPGSSSYSKITGATSNSYKFTTTTLATSGVYYFNVTVNDSLAHTVTASSPSAITVLETATTTIPNSQSGVTLSPISNTIQAGQSNTITAIIAANSTLLDFPPDTYLWYWKTPTSSSYVRISGATSNTYTFAANVLTRPGVYDFNVIVTDGVSQFVTASSPSAITVLATGTSTTTIPATTTTTTIPATTTIPQTSNVVTPSGIEYYIPITFTNAQTASVAANTPLSFIFNAAQYQQYETKTLNNTELFYANGTVADSWIEGSSANELIPANQLYLSSSVLYWFKSPAYNTWLGADTGTASTNTIYLGFAGNTPTPANMLWSISTTGVAPQITCNNPANTISGCAAGQYAKYDTGSIVFGAHGLYQNFAGTTTPASWIKTGVAVTVDNGVSVAYNPTGLTQSIVTSSTYGATSNQILDFMGSLNEPVVNSGLSFDQAGYVTPSTAYEVAYGGNNVNTNIVNFAFDGDPAVSTQGGISQTSSNTINHLWSIYYPSTSSASFQVDYAATNTITTHLPASGTTNIGFVVYAIGTKAQFHAYWLRLRIPAPNNIMPSSSFGSVTSVSTNVISTTTTTIPVTTTSTTTIPVVTTTILPSSPTIILPASVLPSSSSGLIPIAVSGTGFTPGDLVNFGYIPIPPYTNALIAPIANSNGSWSGTFSAPWSAGSYNVIAVDASGVSATATLVVT